MHRNKPRDEAISRGEDRYLDKPCKMGHPGWKYVSNYSCVDCSAIKNKAWMSRHIEERKIWRKDYETANADKIKAYNSSEKTRALRREVSKRQSEKGNAAYHEMMHRIQRWNRAAKWDEDFTEFVSREAHQLARMRDRATGIKWSVDHIIPLRSKIVSGLHVWNNLQVIPKNLNSQKSNIFKVIV